MYQRTRQIPFSNILLSVANQLQNSGNAVSSRNFITDHFVVIMCHFGKRAQPSPTSSSSPSDFNSQKCDIIASANHNAPTSHSLSTAEISLPAVHKSVCSEICFSVSLIHASAEWRRERERERNKERGKMRWKRR
jgi:hypothetical protein